MKEINCLGENQKPIADFAEDNNFPPELCYQT